MACPRISHSDCVWQASPFRHPDLAMAGWANEKPIQLRPGEIRDLGTVTLNPVEPLTVKVLDDAGRPMKNVDLIYESIVGPAPVPLAIRSMTNTEGTHEFIYPPILFAGSKYNPEF